MSSLGRYSAALSAGSRMPRIRTRVPVALLWWLTIPWLSGHVLVLMLLLWAFVWLVTLAFVSQKLKSETLTHSRFSASSLPRNHKTGSPMALCKLWVHLKKSRVPSPPLSQFRLSSLSPYVWKSSAIIVTKLPNGYTLKGGRICCGS